MHREREPHRGEDCTEARNRGGTPPGEADDLSGWQQRALDRSLVEAKRRALNKSNGFVQAAMRAARRDRRAQLHGAGRRRPLEALAAQLLPDVREQGRPAARAVRGVRRHARRRGSATGWRSTTTRSSRSGCSSPASGRASCSPEVVRALALYNLTLSATRPATSPHALEPQLGCCSTRSSAASRRVRCVTTSGSRRLAEILLHTGNAAVHTTILQTGSESPDDVWAFCLGGLRAA